MLQALYYESYKCAKCSDILGIQDYS